MTSTMRPNDPAPDGSDAEAHQGRAQHLADSTDSGTSTRALATGGAVLAGAMFLANAGNYLLNVFLGRWLTPAEFADANLMVTLMLLVTAIAVSLQLVAARFAGINQAAGNEAATTSLARTLERRSLAGGLVLGAVLVAGSSVWADFFNSESAVPFVVLGVGMPAYLAQSVGRGVLQGELDFARLALTFVAEMVARVSLGIGLVAAGLGVTGATIALSVSFVITWLVVRATLSSRSETGLPAVGDPDSKRIPPEVMRYAVPVTVVLIGQIIINNGDVLISKRALAPDTAGVYAAIALVGRAVFFLSWSVVTTLFPAAAQRDERGESTDMLLWAGLGLIAVFGIAAVAVSALLGGIVLGAVFGEAYSDVSSNLARYALATSLFAMANLIASHHLALGRLREAVLLVAGGVLQTALLISMRESIESLVTAQIIAMAILLVATLASHLLRARTLRLKNSHPDTPMPGITLPARST